MMMSSPHISQLWQKCPYRAYYHYRQNNMATKPFFSYFSPSLSLVPPRWISCPRQYYVVWYYPEASSLHQLTRTFAKTKTKNELGLD